MIKQIIIVCITFFLFLNSCSQQIISYGNEIPEDLQKISLHRVFDGDTEENKLYTVSGKITSQCHEDGCWFNLQEGEQTIYVDLSQEGFTMPHSIGKFVTVAGRIINQGTEKNIYATGVQIIP